MLQRLTSLIPSILRHTSGFKKVMDMSEAKKILDVEHSGSTVLERYRHLMKINHPDRGGSSYIASKINEAKNMLINRKSY